MLLKANRDILPDVSGIYYFLCWKSECHSEFVLFFQLQRKYCLEFSIRTSLILPFGHERDFPSFFPSLAIKRFSFFFVISLKAQPNIEISILTYSFPQNMTHFASKKPVQRMNTPKKYAIDHSTLISELWDLGKFILCLNILNDTFTYCSGEYPVIYQKIFYFACFSFFEQSR